METLFKRPANAADLRFVLRCIWSLDPNRHLFYGDFRDFAREKIARMLAPDWGSRGIPYSALDDIEDLLKSCPCSPGTRHCWEKIVAGMRLNLHTIHVMACWEPDYELWQFVRHSFGYGSGRYWCPNAFSGELAIRLPCYEILEAVASSFRQQLDPDTVEDALILWILWCVETLWPDQVDKSVPDYLTPYSLGSQLVNEIERCEALRLQDISPLVSIEADKILRRKFHWCTLAHLLARFGWIGGVLNSLPIDEEDHSGETPLITAIRWRKWVAARWFLDAGADPKAKSLMGEPALAFALRMEAPRSLILRFLRKGADPTQVDGMGDTSLHVAAATDRVSAIKVLTTVPLESRNKLGHTPLYSAVFAMVAGKGSRTAAIKTLLASGADPEPLSKNGVCLSDFLARAQKLGTNRKTIRLIRTLLQ